MKTIITAILCLGLSVTKLSTQSNQIKKLVSTKKSTNMKTINKSAEVVQEFFNAFSKGDFNGIINTFDEDATITAVREGSREGGEIYGSYRGKEGAKTFISNLGNAFNTKSFSVDHIIGEGHIAFANGKFTHEVKSTGKLFSSAWALYVVEKEGKILEYHFYEDSASFNVANTK